MACRALLTAEGKAGAQRKAVCARGRRQSTYHAEAKLLRVVLILGASAQVVYLEVVLVVRVEEADDLRLRVAPYGAHAGARQAHCNDLVSDVREVEIEPILLQPLLLLRY